MTRSGATTFYIILFYLTFTLIYFTLLFFSLYIVYIFNLIYLEYYQFSIMLFGGGIVNIYTIRGGGGGLGGKDLSLCDIEGLYRSSQIIF